MGEVDLEIDCYKKALDLVPDFFDALFALGAAWAIKQSGSAEGIEFIEPNDTVELQDATHQFYLGLSFLALGLSDLMINHIRHLRKLDQSLADRLGAFLNNEGSRTSTTINAANRTEFDDPYDLIRFTVAQDRVYEQVLAELRSGRKRTHWMWYIFPQIDGLGFSQTAKLYAIKSVEEARQYLQHPVLEPRLMECAEAVLSIEGRSARDIFDTPDDLKLKSSMTLFAFVGGSVFVKVLDKYFHGQQDAETRRLIEKLDKTRNETRG